MPIQHLLARPALISGMVFVLGLALSYFLQDAARQSTRQDLQAEFDFRVDEITQSIHRRLQNYELVLKGAAGLFRASHEVGRKEFSEYVDTLKLAGNYPGIQGVGFSQVVRPEDRPRHVAGIRAEGFANYDIWPPGKRELYTSIVYLEPFDWRNQRAFGYDMYSEPVRQAAMARARDEGKTIISGKVRLVQETEQAPQAGFLMYLPVYRPGSPHLTLAERRANLMGWVYAPFRLNDLMTGILGQHFGEITAALDLEIYDGDKPDPAKLMFDSHTQTDGPAGAFHAIKPIQLFGHRWTISVSSLPAFDARLHSVEADIVGLAGLVGSALVALVFWLLLSTRARALTMAQAMTEDLRRSEANKDALFENMSSGVAVFRVSDDGRQFVFVAYNRAAEAMDGLSRDQVLGRRIEEVFPGIGAFGLPEVLRRVWLTGTAEAIPATRYQDERLSSWREVFVYKLPDGSVVAMYNDVSARKQAELEQERLNRALRLLSACNMALVHAEDEYKLMVEICRLIVERGGYVMAWVGYAEHDEAKTVRPIAQSGYETGYLDQINVSWADNDHGQGPTGTAIRTGTTCINQNVLTNPKMAPWREAALKHGYRSSIALPLIGDLKVLGALNIYAREEDAFTPEEVHLLEELANDLAYGIVTLRTRAEHEAAKEKVAFLAYYDSLTHLPNRVLLRDRFQHAMQIAENEGTQLAMLYLDLDNFKQINDSLGHEMGDKVLIKTVERLRHCLPATDTISRLSGDEFLILVSGSRDSDAVAHVANSILAAFSEPMSIDGHLLNASFSIGISLFPDDGTDFDTLLQRADTAVGNAKESGRNTYRFFTREMNAGIQEQMRLAGQLHHAVKNGELVLHYQPQIDIASGRLIGTEALVRWQHPSEGLIPPGRFIPLAEQSGQIVQINEWVLNEACRQAKAWLDAGLPPVVVAVNLSAVQFKRGDVLELVSEVLARTGLPPTQLELELTESILLQDVVGTMKTMQQLKALGVKLSIDDFGTGYSSLAYLKQLAIDKLKIDQSFVRDMLKDADGASIVKAIIQLGETLQLVVIAEGVETAEQLTFLGASGCDEAQGHLISKPMPAGQLVALLERGQPLSPP